MILVWGGAEDPPVERMLAVLAGRDVDVVHLRDADLADLAYDVTLAEQPGGWVDFAGRRVAVDDIEGAYVRPGEPARGRAAAASLTLLALLGTLPTPIVNRPTAGRSNWSKPYQLGVLAGAGFRVPDTLVTTDPASARAFVDGHAGAVYKSVSGIRSIVARIEPGARDRLDAVTTGPVQLQEWIDGTDVRVHVVGERWFATAVDSDAADYRYAGRAGLPVELSACDIPDDLGDQLAGVTRAMGLLVSGADLRRTPTDEWVVFEINPSPGFTYYEEATGQPIADAIADLLCAGRGLTRRRG